MKTTAKQFEEFKTEVLRLQPILGLQDWDICFHHTKKEGVYASTSYNREAAISTILFNTDLTDFEYKNLNIKRSALHECLHLVIADLYCMVESRNFDRFILNQAEEKLIRKLEKFIKL